MPTTPNRSGGWPAFATAAAGYPLHAIRDSYDSVWDEANARGVPEKIYQLVEQVGFHVECHTASTAGTAFETFRTLQRVTAPHIGMGSPSIIYDTIYAGIWQIQRISVNDHGNGCSTVTVSLQKKNAWVWDDGTTVSDEYLPE